MYQLMKFKKTGPTALESEIARLFEQLSDIEETDGEKYDKVSDQLAKLYKLKEIDSKKRVSPDLLVGALSNLAGIFVITQHEHLHVITSKAMGLIGKKIVS